MTSVFQRAREFYREHGLLQFVSTATRYVYNVGIRNTYNEHVRSRLPRRSTITEYNGVAVRPYRYLDRVVPISRPPSKGGHRNPSEYEAAFVDGLRRVVSVGDHVTIVGGGIGVSSVVAARSAGSSGRVTTYEGSESQLAYLADTVELNGVENVEVRHEIVAEGHDLEGPPGDAEVVPSTDLPACDVLAMDCEGAELAILRELTVRPDHVVVETHGNADQVASKLRELEYHVLSRDVAERPPYEDACRRIGIYVLVATADDSQ